MIILFVSKHHIHYIIVILHKITKKILLLRSFLEYNHFEIILIDDFDKNSPPPALALCTASPLDPPPVSQFKQDYLRFWPHGEAMTSVKKMIV